MTTLYAVADAQPASPFEQHALYQVWLGTWNGGLIGVLTDPPGHPIGAPPPEPDLRRLHHVAAVQKMLIHEDLPALTGLSVRDVERVHDEVAGVEFGTAIVTVDGSPVAVDTLVYRGLRFAFGHDVLAHPFAVLRRADADGGWPDLVTHDDTA